jgi:hypothetical protein
MRVLGYLFLTRAVPGTPFILRPHTSRHGHGRTNGSPVQSTGGEIQVLKHRFHMKHKPLQPQTFTYPTLMYVPAAMIRPSGEKATERTQPLLSVWLGNGVGLSTSRVHASISRVVVDHSRTVPSSLAVA